MGIPQFFNWLTRKYNEDIICHFENPDHLFFDFNGIVYQCYARLNYDVLIKKSLHERQNHLIYDVIRYTRHVINTANPSKTVGFFMDGPVPMAKMHQQRLRRYKGPIMKEWENDIKKKYGVFKEELLLLLVHLYENSNIYDCYY
jgi:5'-3' exonuclease